MECILTFDIGTTSVKTCLFDLSLNRLCCISEEYLIDADGLFIELDAEAYIDAIKKSITKARELLPDAHIKAVTSTTQGETLIAVSKDGKALRKAIVWLDSRAEKEASLISESIPKKEFARTTGLPELTGACPITKLLWIKNNEPQIYDECEKFLFLEDWVIFRLTGKFISEKALVSSSGYFDINGDCYWDKILDVAGIAKEKLPEARECGEFCSYVTKEAADFFGLPSDTAVYTGAMDQVASAIGAGALTEDIITETTGTALVVTSYSKERRYYAEKGITEYRHARQGGYLNLTFSNTAGIVLKWFKDAFFSDLIGNGTPIYEQLDKMAESVSPLSDGLCLFPHFEGTSYPEINTDARGVFFGIGLGTTRAHFIRAILEGVSYMLRENIESISSDAKEIRSLGGASGSDVWCQIKADVINKQIVTYEAESTSLGAAILTACGMGLYKNLEDAIKVAKPKKTYTPDTNSDLYEGGYRKYLAMYDAFKHLF